MGIIFNYIIKRYSLSRKYLHTSSIFCASNKKKNPVIFKTKLKKPVIEITKTMPLIELAELINRTPEQIIEHFSQYHSTKLNENSIIKDTKLLIRIIEVCGYKYKWKMIEEEHKAKDLIIHRPPPDPLKMIKRPPVVTIMGHVDHGKTTLLDTLQKSNITSQEFGGITQHIGAFSVKLSTGEMITFLDTPGHAAFASMRARGAMVTDIVVLVVAADDGIMKQTIESIRYAQEANVSIIVAINKIDKSEADAERTMREFLQHGIQLEAFGGDVQSVQISALKGTNLQELQECILAQAELLDLKADPTGLVEAACIESKTDSSRGKLSTALIQRGTLKKSMILVAGTAWAKVRAMFDDKGRPMLEAKPGFPVEILGWRELPSAGEQIYQVETEQQAKKLIEQSLEAEKTKKIVADSVEIDKRMTEHRMFYDEMRKKKLEMGYRGGRVFRNVKQKEYIEKIGPELCIVLKGDVDGSVEAILDILDSYTSDQCRLNVLSYGVGPINAGDIEMAKIFNGEVYGFNVKVGEKISTDGVPIHNFNVIYRLIADIEQNLTERLEPLPVEEIIGEANVLANFTVTEGKKKVFVAGCRCVKGLLIKKNKFKLVRHDQVLLEGELQSLKHFKNEVDQIKFDVECGLSFVDQAVQPMSGDTVVCFQVTSQKQKLNWNLDFL